MSAHTILLLKFTTAVFPTLLTAQSPIGRDESCFVRLGDVLTTKQTLAFQLKPKMRVSMHCNSCARKKQKHISKMDGVTSFQVELENKKVVVIGDILPFEVLESISNVKNAEILRLTK
ncbi:hypothetical protein ACHQM5_012715 [Ranunculus cassubicifolius]